MLTHHFIEESYNRRIDREEANKMIFEDAQKKSEHASHRHGKYLRSFRCSMRITRSIRTKKISNPNRDGLTDREGNLIAQSNKSQSDSISGF